MAAKMTICWCKIFLFVLSWKYIKLRNYYCNTYYIVQWPNWMACMVLSSHCNGVTMHAVWQYELHLTFAFIVGGFGFGLCCLKMAGEVYRIEKVFRFLNKRKFLYLLFHQHNGSDLNNDIYSSHSNFINENAISDFVMLFTDFFAGRESAGRPWAEYNHETCGQNILFIYFAADVGEG